MKAIPLIMSNLDLAALDTYCKAELGYSVRGTSTKPGDLKAMVTGLSAGASSCFVSTSHLYFSFLVTEIVPSLWSSEAITFVKIAPFAEHSYILTASLADWAHFCESLCQPKVPKSLRSLGNQITNTFDSAGLREQFGPFKKSILTDDTFTLERVK
jgi:hypothetical protein